MEIKVEFFGDLACFTPPQASVERVSMPFPTPSAVRGMLSSVYMKPAEFAWQVNRIEVLEPIQYISFKRNELKSTQREQPIYTDDDRTQRQTVALKDVRYRIYASILPREDFHGSVEQLYAQALRRFRSGKNFLQPSLGLREFVAYYEESDGRRAPIPVDLDAGLMVYDIFEPNDFEIRKKTRTRLSLYHAVMKQGVIEVPPYDSPLVLKGEASC